MDENLRRELRKILKIEAAGRKFFKDDRLTIFDLAGIRACSVEFRVLQFHAYLRAKSLGLLVSQRDMGCDDCGSTMSDEDRKQLGSRCRSCEEIWQKTVDDWRHGGENSEMEKLFGGTTETT